MSATSSLVFGLIMAGLLPAHAAGITFTPVIPKPGESVRVLSHSESVGATTSHTAEGRTTRGTLSRSRDHDLVWTFRTPAEDGTRRGMVKVNQLTTASKTVINGKEDAIQTVSPLTHKLFSISKPPTGEWKVELDGSVPNKQVTEEIDELHYYLKPSWYPSKPVDLGDAWEFDPIWIKHLLQRDVPKSQTIATMKLRQVRSSAGRESALIDISIRSSGTDFRPDGTEVNVSFDLTGQVLVNLTTMLEESLDLKGTIISTTSTAVTSTKVTLPITLRIQKSFVRDSP